MFGMWSSKPTLPSEIKVPSLKQLTDLCGEVEQEYAKLGSQDQGKVQALHLLKASLDFIKSHQNQSQAAELAFAEWLNLFVHLDRTTYFSRLKGILLEKFKKLGADPSLLTPAQKMAFLNGLYQFKFFDHKEKYQEIYTAQFADLTLAKTLQLEYMRMVFKPIHDNNSLYLKRIPNEATADQIWKDAYQHYIAETKYDNPTHRAFARLLEAVVNLNPEDEKDNNNTYLSYSYRTKIGFAALLRCMVRNANYLYSYFPIIRSVSNSAFHRTIDYGLCNNFDMLTPELQHECYCAVQHFLLTANRKEMESKINDRTKYPKEAPLLIHSELCPLQEALTRIIKHEAPKPYSLASNRTLAFATIMAIITGMLGESGGIALGYAAGLTDQAESLKFACKGVSGEGIKFVLGRGGSVLGYYGSNIFVNEALKFSLGALVGSLCAMIGFATGAAVSITIFDVTPNVVSGLIKAYHVLRNDPQVRPILDQKLFKDLDPELLRCLKNLPEEVLPAEELLQIKRLEGDKKAIATLFNKEQAPPANHPEEPNRVLAKR